jgi:hypothetical protein
MAQTPEYRATIAHRAAAQVGCEALRWWLDAGDPHWVRIEARLSLPTGTARRVRLLAFLGLEGQERPGAASPNSAYSAWCGNPR